MPNFASLSCFYSKLRWGGGGLFCPPVQNRVPEYPVQNRVKVNWSLSPLTHSYLPITRRKDAASLQFVSIQ